MRIHGEYDVGVYYIIINTNTISIGSRFLGFFYYTETSSLIVVYNIVIIIAI